MKINTIKVNARFSYLWLKTVIDVDLTQHCAKCLIGEYDERINPRVKGGKDILLKNNVYYLCGVAFPFNWNNNFHLAFMPSEGNSVTFESNGIYVEIENAIQLPISDQYIYHEKQKFKTYRTCRCWQFANYFNVHLK